MSISREIRVRRQQAEQGSYPAMCMHCGNVAAVARNQKTLHWTPRWVLLLALVSLPVALIAAAVTSRKQDVQLYTCSDCAIHAERTPWQDALALLASLGLIGGGVYVLCMSAVAVGQGLLAAGVVLGIGYVVARGQDEVKLVRIDGDDITLRLPRCSTYSRWLTRPTAPAVPVAQPPAPVYAWIPRPLVGESDSSVIINPGGLIPAPAASWKQCAACGAGNATSNNFCNQCCSRSFVLPSTLAWAA